MTEIPGFDSCPYTILSTRIKESEDRIQKITGTFSLFLGRLGMGHGNIVQELQVLSLCIRDIAVWKENSLEENNRQQALLARIATIYAAIDKVTSGYGKDTEVGRQKETLSQNIVVFQDNLSHLFVSDIEGSSVVKKPNPRTRGKGGNKVVPYSDPVEPGSRETSPTVPLSGSSTPEEHKVRSIPTAKGETSADYPSGNRFFTRSRCSFRITSGSKNIHVTGMMKTSGTGGISSRKRQFETMRGESVCISCDEPERIETEIDILDHLRGSPHIVIPKEILYLDNGHVAYIRNRSEGEYPFVKKNMGKKEQAFVLSDAIKGLAEAHKKGVIHGNVHSKNIAVYKNRKEEFSGKMDNWQFADFVDTLPARSKCSTEGISRSPEARSGRIREEASDVYDAALMLYEAFLPPDFLDASGEEKKFALRRAGDIGIDPERLDPEKIFSSKARANLAQILEQALQARPEKRISMEQLSKRFDTWIKNTWGSSRMQR